MLNMIEIMKSSEAIEIGLRSGHIMYGRFKDIADGHFIMISPEGETIFIPADDSNIAYIKTVSADPEISANMDKLYGKAQSSIIEEEEPPSRRVDVPPVILSKAPERRQTNIEQVKERWRHNTNFTANARPAFKPRIESEEDKEDK
jgi:hypothetical protein